MGARKKTGKINGLMEEDTHLVYTGGTKLLEDDGYILSMDGDGLTLELRGEERKIDCGEYAAVFLNLSVDYEPYYEVVSLDALEDVPVGSSTRVWSGLVTSNGFSWRCEDDVLYITSITHEMHPNSTEKLAGSFRILVGDISREAHAEHQGKPGGKQQGTLQSKSDLWEEPFNHFMDSPSKQTFNALRTPALRKEAKAMKEYDPNFGGGRKLTGVMGGGYSVPYSKQFELNFSRVDSKPHTYHDLVNWLKKHVGSDSFADEARFALVMRFERRFRSAKNGHLDGFYLA